MSVLLFKGGHLYVHRRKFNDRQTGCLGHAFLFMWLDSNDENSKHYVKSIQPSASMLLDFYGIRQIWTQTMQTTSLVIVSSGSVGRTHCLCKVITQNNGKNRQKPSIRVERRSFSE